MSNRHRNGKGISTKHTTVTEIAGMIVNFLQTHQGVKNICLGAIQNFKGKGEWRVKINNLGTCIKVIARQSCSSQDLWIYTESNQAEEVVRDLEAFIQEQKWKLQN